MRPSLLNRWPVLSDSARLVAVACLSTILVVMFSGLGPARAQGSAPSYQAVLAAQWNTGYAGLKRTTLISNRRVGTVEARVVQTQRSHRMVTVVSPAQRAGETQVDDGHYLWHYNPSRHIVSVLATQIGRHQWRSGSRAQPVLRPAGTEVVAGRATAIYDVIPVNADRPALRWWVDTQTLVPLRTELTTRDGKQVTEEYEEISYGEQGRIRFVWPHDAVLAVYTWMGTKQRGPLTTPGIPLVLPMSVPPELTLDGAWARQLAGRQVLWLHYHHGAADASLFESTGGPPPTAPDGSGILSWNVGQVNIVMVSNLPPAAQALLRNSCRLVH